MDDLRVLREFRERGSITATADALHLTPSAVSQQLARIARDLGFEVLQHVGRGVVLTPRGHALLAHADTVFAEIQRARHELDSWDDSVRGTIAIGSFSTAITGLLPLVLDRARDGLPEVKITVAEAEPPALFDSLDCAAARAYVPTRSRKARATWVQHLPEHWSFGLTPNHHSR